MTKTSEYLLITNRLAHYFLSYDLSTSLIYYQYVDMLGECMDEYHETVVLDYTRVDKNGRSYLVVSESK